MAVTLDGTHRAVIAGFSPEQLFGALEVYGRNMDPDLAAKIPKLRRSYEAVQTATCNTVTLPEADNGSRTHFMTLEVYDQEGTLMALYYHSNTTGQYDLLLSTGEYIAGLIS